jgi:enterochelin esterase-like enzyme
MKTFAFSLVILLATAVAWTGASSQIPNRPPTIADSVVSVKISDDNRVTFSIFAPKASEVTVNGDFRMGSPPASLTKNADGIWSFTSDPIPPDSYTYNFNVDGVMVLDTKSQTFRENPNSLFNYFDMPGVETEFMALKDVPHGRVESVIYHSNSLNMERRMHVYLPPNFQDLKGKLPVLYLLHGGGDNDISWTSAGKMNLVLDNLYAAGKVKNMIVVMPAGHVPGQVRPLMSMTAGGAQDPFIKDFLTDLMPYVENTYPISTKRDETAIAGFSMGGVQTMNLALWHPDKFGYVYPMGTGYFPDGIKDIEAKSPEVLEKIAKDPFKRWVFGQGKQDTLSGPNNLATRHLFDKYHIKYEYREINGGHSFVFGRRFLAGVLPQMFR